MQSETKKHNAVDKVKEQLQKLGYEVIDEKALAELMPKDGKLQISQVSLLIERGIISLKDDEPEKPAAVSQSMPRKTEKPKIFSISEAADEKNEVQRQVQPTPKPKSTGQRVEELKKQRQPQADKLQQPVAPKKAEDKENKPEVKTKEPEWVENYPAALQKWCDKNLDKKTGQPKRKISEIRTNLDDKQNPVVDIEVAPLSPIARKRGDFGAVYTVKKSPQPEKIDVTVKSKEPGKPLNYDYFYALVKAAHDNGADTIEFNNIRTPEFRDKLLAAALQFKMKLKNPPGVINLEAEHLDTIPPGCRQYLEKHNEAVRKALERRGKEIVPSKGEKYGTGPRAEGRTHAEKEFIESEQIMEKLRKADKRRQEMENEEKAEAEEEGQYFDSCQRRVNGITPNRGGKRRQSFRPVKSR